MQQANLRTYSQRSLLNGERMHGLGFPRRVLGLSPLGGAKQRAGFRRTGRLVSMITITARQEHQHVAAAAAAQPTSVPVRFTLQREVRFGQSHVVVGDHPALGNWVAREAPQMSWGEGHVWETEVSLPPGTALEFKCVRVTSGQDNDTQWEGGHNRVLHIPASGVLSMAVKVDWSGDMAVTAEQAAEVVAPRQQLAAAEAAPQQPVAAAEGRGMNGAAPAARPASPPPPAQPHRAWPDREFVAETKEAFPGKGVADVEEARVLISAANYTFLDVRTAIECEDVGRVRYSVNIPQVDAQRVWSAEEQKKIVVAEPNHDWLAQVQKRFPSRTAPLLVACADGEQYAPGAVRALVEAGYTNVVRLSGGYNAWNQVYDGKMNRRKPGGAPAPPAVPVSPAVQAQKEHVQAARAVLEQALDSSSSSPTQPAATESSPAAANNGAVAHAEAPPAEPASGSRTFVRGRAGGSKRQAGRWRSLDADQDMSDDQQDIVRGRQMVDSLFQGAGGMNGTHNAVLSSTEYLSMAARNLNNIEDGFYISPAFLDKLSIHVAKNYMELPKVKVPLILGIWGGKGQGKTFQCNLAFKKLGINPIVMSAGELESGNAGEPAKLIRQRYREASDIIKKGKMCALFINDLDAGAGRMGDATQYTVNNQMVNATLMNIADNPTNVQLPGVYKTEKIPRVPIVCTGNDFSTLYAPLIRDGRMEKYYWNPTREDRVGVCMGIFQYDGLDRGAVESLVDAFPGQSIDFFGAVRARVYDDKVREWITGLGVENMGKRLINSREGKVEFEKPAMNLAVLIKYGNLLVEEQENVKRVQLADAYLSGAELAGSSGTSLPEQFRAT